MEEDIKCKFKVKLILKITDLLVPGYYNSTTSYHSFYLI